MMVMITMIVMVMILLIGMNITKMMTMITMIGTMMMMREENISRISIYQVSLSALTVTTMMWVQGCWAEGWTDQTEGRIWRYLIPDRGPGSVRIRYPLPLQLLGVRLLILILTHLNSDREVRRKKEE